MLRLATAGEAAPRPGCLHAAAWAACQLVRSGGVERPSGWQAVGLPESCFLSHMLVCLRSYWHAVASRVPAPACAPSMLPGIGLPACRGRQARSHVGSGQLEALCKGAAAAEGHLPQHWLGALGRHWPGPAPLAAAGHRWGAGSGLRGSEPRMACVPLHACLRRCRRPRPLGLHAAPWHCSARHAGARVRVRARSSSRPMRPPCWPQGRLP